MNMTLALIAIPPAFEDFGAINNLGQNIGDSVVYTNDTGYSSIGFTLVVPSGGAVEFLGSYNGVDYIPITMLATDGTGYVRAISYDDTFLGSIASLRSFMVRTTAAGSADGSVTGRASNANTVLDGINQGNPPAKVGTEIVHLGFEYTTPQTDTVIGIVLPPELTYIFTDLYFSVSGTGRVTFFDEINDFPHWAFCGDFAVPLDQTEHIARAFAQPFRSIEPGGAFRITTTGTCRVLGNAHGYFLPSA